MTPSGQFVHKSKVFLLLLIEEITSMKAMMALDQDSESDTHNYKIVWKILLSHLLMLINSLTLFSIGVCDHHTPHSVIASRKMP